MATRRWILFLLFIFTLPTLAVEEDYPPTLNPADFLIESVQVIEQHPIFNVDNLAQQFYYFDPATGTWLIYDFPIELIEENYPFSFTANRRSDGTYLIIPLGPNSSLEVERAWLFDPISETVSETPYACGTIQSLPNRGRWIKYQNPETGSYHLCHTSTGELSPSIPAEIKIEPCEGESYRRPTTQLDQNHILFSDCGLWQQFVNIYVYDFETQTFRHLGESEDEDNENLRVIRILEDGYVLLQSHDSRNGTFFTYYLANIHEENSLQFVASQFRGGLQIHENPLRIEWVKGEFLSGGIHEDATPAEIEAFLQDWCGLRIYNLETRELMTYPRIDRVCGVGNPIEDGSGDRLYRYTDWWETAELIRFNPFISESQTLYQGEIEAIWDIDENSNIATILIGSDGFVTVAPTSLMWDLSADEEYRLLEISLINGDVLSEMPLDEINDDTNTDYVPLHEQFLLSSVDELLYRFHIESVGDNQYLLSIYDATQDYSNEIRFARWVIEVE